MISEHFEKNMVEPGEMVGVIAATGTGEPLTQMNLNSFHQAGVARMTGTTQGVPRMREIFSVTKNRIQHRPLSFYQNIIDTLDSSSDPITGHYCERAWGYIFNI